jgi:hypothetical protein
MTVEEIASRFNAKRNGEGWQAKCPAHDDHTPSLSINKGTDGCTLLHCHAGCPTESVLSAVGLTPRDLFNNGGDGNGSRDFRQTRRRWPPVAEAGLQRSGSALTLSEMHQKSPRPSFDWESCLAAFTQRHRDRLSEWRGYSPEFCSWLHSQKLVGVYEGCVALPVHDSAGTIIGAHYRPKDGKAWFYSPTVIKTAPLVIGELIPGDPIHVFESQWDAFAYMDKSGERSGLIITRSASNGALVSGLIPQSSTVYVWTQNDAAGEKWEKDVCANTKVKVKRVKILSQFKDLNAWTKDGRAATDDLLAAITSAEVIQEAPRPLIEFKSPSQLKNYVPPPGLMLVGDCHIVRGSVFVIGGAPGVGKSRASVALAEAGATGHEWFGLTAHRKFKTMIVQTENGQFRLSREFGALDCDALEDYVRVCPPPPFGLCFGRDDFKAQLSAAILAFRPDVVFYDPWNAAARDERAREYLDTFEALRSVLPLGDNAPALGIVAHTRKPKSDERASGRALLNLLAGSYVLGSVPRTVFVMQAASDDTTDNRVVWTCCKNNDGDLGARSAWERRNGLFAPVTEFDWDTFDNPHPDERARITADDLSEVFENGQKQLTKADAVKALQTLTRRGRTACYNALELDGRFSKHLREIDGIVSWKI